MFFLASILSAFFYAIGASFLAHFARKIDPFFITALRGFFLFFWMAPLLFFANKNEIVEVLKFWPQILLVGFYGALTFASGMVSMKFLPLGITSAFRAAVRVILIFLFSFFFFKEGINFWQILGTALILIAGGFLSIKKYEFAHLIAKKKVLGFLLAAFSASGAVLFWLFGAKLSREISPFAAAYFLESTVSIGSIFLLLGRKIFYNHIFFAPINFKEIGQVFLISGTVLIGTGGFFLATKLGPINIASAIGASGVLFAALFGALFFNEKLNFRNWLEIIIILLGIVILQISS